MKNRKAESKLRVKSDYIDCSVAVNPKEEVTGHKAESPEENTGLCSRTQETPQDESKWL